MAGVACVVLSSEVEPQTEEPIPENVGDRLSKMNKTVGFYTHTIFFFEPLSASTEYEKNFVCFICTLIFNGIPSLFHHYLNIFSVADNLFAKLLAVYALRK